MFGVAGVVVAVAGYCFVVLVLLFGKKKTLAPLPPSPPGEFLFSHYRVVPIDAPFKNYAKYKYSICNRDFSGVVVCLLAYFALTIAALVTRVK